MARDIYLIFAQKDRVEGFMGYRRDINTFFNLVIHFDS